MDPKGPAYQQPPPPGFAPPPPYSPGPPPPGMPPAPGVVFVQQTASTFGPDPMRMTCPHCQASISTRVDTEPNTKTHLFALLLCILGCWPCAPCPYCMDTCLAKKHYCPACKQYLGQYEP
ncbi:lipopolysaccharide-induced tumor necrosis factor-alpha factor homolog [Chelonus insularis]|uniref:lipopolysaccharide-induced tumor necrosis factor-alpha factor homolog n=1 Tax=Chelonus insularis TaxID=460826 RepID=UPI00158C8AAA|nr:lipopolysaccharide-induced tumor necrosis factor-alpha factor homolog [Chelonus insularis]